MNIWLENIKKIDRHNQEANRERHSYRLEMNEFGDLVSFNFI